MSQAHSEVRYEVHQVGEAGPWEIEGDWVSSRGSIPREFADQQDLSYWLKEPATVICRAFAGELEVGFVVLVQIAYTGGDAPGDYKALFIATHPDYRRRGIATGMMRHVQAKGYRVDKDVGQCTEAGAELAYSLGLEPFEIVGVA